MSSYRVDLVARMASEVVVRLCGFATLPLLARSLGSDGYGVVVGSGTIVSGFAAIAALGLSYHVGRIVSRGETDAARRLLRQVLLLAGASGLAWALIVVLASSWLNARFLDRADGGLAIACASGSLIAWALDGVLLEWLRQRERFRSLSALQAGIALAQLAALLIVVPRGAGPVTVLLLSSAMQLLRIAVMVLLIRHSPRAVPAPSSPLGLTLGSCVRDGLTLTVGALGAWGLSQGGRLVLGSATAIGGYSVAAALATVSAIVGSAAGMPLSASLARAVAARNPVGVALAVRRFAGTYQTLALPGVVIASFLAENAIRCLTGFHGLGGIAAVLLWSGWIDMGMLPMIYALWAHGWASRSRNAQFAAAAGAVLGTLVLVRLIGPIGVAWSTFCGELALLAMLAWGLRHARFPWRALIPRDLWPILLAAALAGAAASWLRGETWLSLITAATAACVAGAAPLAIGRATRMLRLRRSDRRHSSPP
jgi:O-antigen/teichoic acid export membrane protein